MLNTSFNSLEEEVRVKTEKLDKLRERFLQAKEEIKDMEEEYRRERDDLWVAVRDLGACVYVSACFAGLRTTTGVCQVLMCIDFFSFLIIFWPFRFQGVK